LNIKLLHGNEKRQRWSSSQKTGKKGANSSVLGNKRTISVLRGLLKTLYYRGMGELLRAMVFDKKIRIMTECADARKLQYELAKIGANINQIAHRCNIDAIGGKTSRLHLSDKYVISRACNIIEKALKKKVT